MKEELEFILSAIALIVMTGFLAYGFSGITGYSSKEMSSTSISVSPEISKPGQYINININTDGKWGVHDRFNICKGTLCYSSGSLDCTGYGCRGNINVNYRLPSNLIPGQYYVKIKDINTKTYLKGYFAIK